eukprot:CAMPEP_0119102912 /NCGR_PEP_ID=MMETSP1180-20130426/1501_1 /TAXON_ID=3052 ORGANISM="Chlamydomonas cf sp, Strain CCMP681" /NCGR_SAMPLE_ID=MMETSP1180 /ASSEMBLY_ACC=CAM_ASM_000741 /LENGTH=97 /DNA_ID=CAMNT_0007087293 /DNA_START=798 /DNA_END=1091 /DNA_ORIENTATION=-
MKPPKATKVSTRSKGRMNAAARSPSAMYASRVRSPSGSLAMTAVKGVPRIVATIPTWSSFSSKWSSGHICVMAEQMWVVVAAAQKMTRAWPPSTRLL